MSQWGFYYDQTRCVACKACVIACKEWNENRRGDIKVNPEYDTKTDYSKNNKIMLPDMETIRRYYSKENWRRVSSEEYGDFPKLGVLNLSISCNHCDNPACIPACPVDAISKDKERGIVINDSAKCISCGSCREACPWKAPQFYDEKFSDYEENDPKRPRMTKCDMCRSRLDNGLKPACVAACPMRALDAAPLDELKTKYKGASVTVKNINAEDVKERRPSIVFKAKNIG